MADDNQPSQWSPIANNNATVGGGLAIGENVTPMSNLNNMGRAIMAGVTGALTFVATSDTADAYTASLAPAIDAYTSSFLYCAFFGTANTTTAPTLNLNSIGAKAITRQDGSAVAVGNINGAHILEYDGTNFRVLNPVIPQLSTLTNSLGGDVSLTSTVLYFDGPSIAQGTSGIWFVSGQVTCQDTNSGSGVFFAKLWDGTTVIDSAVMRGEPDSGFAVIPLSGVIASPTGNIKISVLDQSNSANAAIKFNVSGNAKDSTLTAIRLG